MPHWIDDGEQVVVEQAPTIFGDTFGYRLRHDAAARTITVEIIQAPPGDVAYVYPCRFGMWTLSQSTVKLSP
jgi:hypothetical protein